MIPRTTYAARLEALAPSLRAVFVHLDCDEGTQRFIAAHPPHNKVQELCRDMLSLFVPRVDAAALLGMHEMHVLGEQSFARLLAVDGSGSSNKCQTRLLDVGAGTGAVTAQLAPLFADVHTTEVSWPCLRSLRNKGLQPVHSANLGSRAITALASRPSQAPQGWGGGETGADVDMYADGNFGFDVISLCNVLDRVHDPAQMLRQAQALLAPSGKMLITAAIPFVPFVVSPRVGRGFWSRLGLGRGEGRSEAPKVPLITPSQSGKDAVGSTACRADAGSMASWEAHVNELATALLSAAGGDLEVEALARFPYLCQGDSGTCGSEFPFYALDSVCFVLRSRSF
eukprot:g1702.t1